MSGQVTFAGGAPPAPGAIHFATLEPAPGFVRRPASAEFDAGGSYETEAFAGAKGLVPGTYRVHVECWKIVPEMGKPGESYVDDNFAAPDLTVPVDGGSITHDVDVNPKPAAN